MNNNRFLRGERTRENRTRRRTEHLEYLHSFEWGCSKVLPMSVIRPPPFAITSQIEIPWYPFPNKEIRVV